MRCGVALFVSAQQARRRQGLLTFICAPTVDLMFLSLAILLSSSFLTCGWVGSRRSKTKVIARAASGVRVVRFRGR